MGISDQIIKVLDALSEKVGMAIDWSSNNIVPYIQQLCSKYVNYKISTSVLWLIVGIAIAIFGFILQRKLKNNKDFGVTRYEYTGDDYISRYVAYAGIAFIYCLGILVIVLQLMSIITCVTFPEKIIIDELLPLIK